MEKRKGYLLKKELVGTVGTAEYKHFTFIDDDDDDELMMRIFSRACRLQPMAECEKVSRAY